MDRRRAAGALLALAACIATTAAAPTASNQTALDLYDGASEGCYYNFQHYGEGDRIMTNEPCLNCTCHNRMLMCYLRVCPFTKPIGQDCSVEKRADQCCPIVTCPDVPVDLLTSTSTSSPSEYGDTGVGKLDRYGCSINGKYFSEGSKVPPSPNKPCEHCYCIRNMTTCVMQECTLHVDGCTPIYHKDVCCPVRYSCDHPEDEIPLLDDMTTTVRPTPGFLLTTTTISSVTQMTQDCVHDDKIFADGALIKTEKACEHCYCMKGDIVCVVQECGTPMENEGKNCTSMPPREGQCCPDTYICEGDEQTTETKPDIGPVSSFEDITTLSPTRRVSVEGSGYRSETDEPSTEGPIFEPDSEGSGEDEPPFKPTDPSEMVIPESETSPPFITTTQDHTDKYSPGSTEEPGTDKGITEKATTEADKGENTVPSGDVDEDTSDASVADKMTPEPESITTKPEEETEPSIDTKTTALQEDVASVTDKTTPHEEIKTTEPTYNAETTPREELPVTEPASTADYDLNTPPDARVTSEGEIAETTVPSRRKEDDEMSSTEITTPKHLEESTNKASDQITPDTVIPESTTSPFIEIRDDILTSKIPEKESEGKEPTTETNLDHSTQFDIKTDDQSATTIQPEITTELPSPSRVDLTDTTSVNPNENEIDEESFPTLAPGRIPGEGDCLLDGVTYSHESIVPSSSNCHTSCRCISSIVKCEPIICSPPPDYMDNCQPMYDSPESCCPTYVCDHPKETVPPQSHSQMAGTESPMPTPTIECNGDQCEIIKDKEGAKPPVLCNSEGCTDDSSKTPDKTASCGIQGCGEVESKPEEAHPSEPTKECTGASCASPPIQCTSGECGAVSTKEQTCNNENGCEISVVQKCEGDNCATQPNVTATKDDSTPCDDPDSCKNVHIPDNETDCTDSSCTKSPSQTIPHDKQDCQDGDNCEQTPGYGECKEENCKTQQVPEIDKPAPSNCIGSECIQQQDNVPQTTDVPELSTESVPKVTELHEISYHTDLPKTTTIKMDSESSATTKASISDTEEEVGTTSQYEEHDPKKQTDSEPIVTTSSERVTSASEDQQQESVTEGSTDEETIKDILPEVTPTLSEVPIMETPITSDKDTKEVTTESQNVDDTESTETITRVDDKYTEIPETNQPEDITQDKDVHDITTAQPPLPTTFEINRETTETQEMLTKASESLDRDGHKESTKQQDTEPKVTEPTAPYTSKPEVIDKLEVQEKDPHETLTTPKSYDSVTNIPGIPETKLPEMPSSVVSETPTTTPQQGGKQPEYVSATEEPITDKPADAEESFTDTGKTETPVTSKDDETTAKPEMSLDGSGIQSPDLNTTPGDEQITKTPIREISSEPESVTQSSQPLVTLPQETTSKDTDVDKDLDTPAPVTVNVETQTPMSIVKDRGDDEMGNTVAPESGLSTESDQLVTKEPESPESEPSIKFTSKPSETPTEKPVSDLVKVPSVTDAEHDDTSTEKLLETTTSAIVENVHITKEPVTDIYITAVPKTETKTDSTPINTAKVSSEPSVTEAGIQEASTPQEQTSVDTPIASTPSDDILKESLEGDFEGVELTTPVQQQTNEDTDVTKLPELVIHEHPTEPSSVKEPEQFTSGETATTLSGSAGTEPQEITPDKDMSKASTPQDAVTQVPELPSSVTQKESTEVSDQESITKMPEILHPLTTDSVPEKDLSHTTESFTTDSQNLTESPESQTVATNAPEVITTEAQKKDIEAPAVEITSGTEPQEAVTEGMELHHTVTDADMIVTQSHKDTTEAPISHDIVTNAPNIDTEKYNEATDRPEGLKTDAITTAVPEISPTELQKLTTTETPEDTATQISDTISVVDNETAEPQDTVTTVPKISEIAPQETTNLPETEDMASITSKPPETEPKKDAAPDVVTSIPEILTTETVLLEDSNIPVVEDKATSTPDISVTKPQMETTERPTPEDATSTISDLHAFTEPEQNTPGGPTKQQGVTLPDTSIKESDKNTPVPETQEPATDGPELPETDSKKETTVTPESQETVSSIPESPPTEPTNLSQDVVTNAPGEQGVGTTIPEVSTESQNKVTETPEITVTEPHSAPVELPESQNTVADLLTTVMQKEATESPEISPTMATHAPEILVTKSDKDVTDTSEPVSVTKAPQDKIESSTYEAEIEQPVVTEKAESSTETSLKITTKFDDHTQSELQEFATTTEAPHDISLPMEGGIPVEDDEVTTVTKSPATESPEKTTGLDIDTDKPLTDIATPVKKPEEPTEATKTESPILSEPLEPEINAPELIDSEAGTTPPAPESTVTEKQHYTLATEIEPLGSRRTEATNAPVKEDAVTKGPEIEPLDKTTKTSEKHEQTTESKEEHSETTPYLLLEEHTHQTVLHDEETTASPSDIPLNEHELSTPEAPVDEVTESVLIMETEKSPQDVFSNKDPSVTESAQTTISEKITESSLVSEEITTAAPSLEPVNTEKPQSIEPNEISTSVPVTGKEPNETESPLVPSIESETEKQVEVTSGKPSETNAPEEEFILATSKATTIKAEEELTTPTPLFDKYGKPDENPKPAAEPEKPKPDTTEEIPKPGANEVQPTEEALQPEEESHFPPSGTSGYGQEPDYGEEDSFGPGTCRYGGKVYVSAQQIPRDDPCDFCFCFRSDIICLQQSCPPPIHGCHEEPIQGFCCPRYECPVSMATTLNVTTTTTTTTTTLPPHFLPHAYKGAAQRRGCQIKGHTYKVGEVVRASSGPCLHCTCGGDGQMKCDPKVCTPEPMLRQMIAAAVSAKRRR